MQALAKKRKSKDDWDFVPLEEAVAAVTEAFKPETVQIAYEKKRVVITEKMIYKFVD